MPKRDGPRDVAEILTALTMYLLFGCFAIVAVGLAVRAFIWIVNW